MHTVAGKALARMLDSKQFKPFQIVTEGGNRVSVQDPHGAVLGKGFLFVQEDESASIHAIPTHAITHAGDLVFRG